MHGQSQNFFSALWIGNLCCLGCVEKILWNFSDDQEVNSQRKAFYMRKLKKESKFLVFAILTFRGNFPDLWGTFHYFFFLWRKEAVEKNSTYSWNLQLPNIRMDNLKEKQGFVDKVTTDVFFSRFSSLLKR